MDTSLNQYPISDFIEWQKRKQLELNPAFQRRDVWTPAAKVYLIDTILRGFPIPKIYLRSKVDTKTQSGVREVVDGQQRLRAILDFAHDKFPLSNRAGDLDGLKYSLLPDAFKEQFLHYPLTVEQFMNADDSKVLEAFARLNSYGLSLTAAEKRHAHHQSEFKWAVNRSAQEWKTLWENYEVLSTRDRVRMRDDSLMAEMYGIFIAGVCDGGEAKINILYKKQDQSSEEEIKKITEKVDSTLNFLVDELASAIEGTPLMRRRPHFLMLFAALAHALQGIPQGDLNDLPASKKALPNLDYARSKLQELSAVLDEGAQIESSYLPFWQASQKSTQRISSRRVRFMASLRALQP